MIASVFVDIEKERARQDEKWGGAKHDDLHTSSDWVSFILEHAEKADEAESDEQYRRRLVEVAALAVAAIEALDRYTEKRLTGWLQAGRRQ